MKRLMLAIVMTFWCVTCNAEPLKSLNCDSSRINGVSKVQHSANSCSAQRLAQQSACSCTTYAGTQCSGPCISAGKPYGCLCK